MIQQVPKSLQHLAFLFNAGAGEFYFFNEKLNRTFCIKFIPFAGVSNWSKVFVKYVKAVRELRNDTCWWHFGRYNFTKRLLEVSNETLLSEQGLKTALIDLDVILNSINTGKELPSEIRSYYGPRCCRCGKSLFNSKSIELGLGSECIDYYKQQQPVLQLNLF